MLTGSSGLSDSLEPFVELDIVFASFFGRLEQLVGVVQAGDLLSVGVLSLRHAGLVIMGHAVKSSLLRSHSGNPLLGSRNE